MWRTKYICSFSSFFTLEGRFVFVYWVFKSFWCFRRPLPPGAEEARFGTIPVKESLVFLFTDVSWDWHCRFLNVTHRWVNTVSFAERTLEEDPTKNEGRWNIKDPKYCLYFSICFKGNWKSRWDTSSRKMRCLFLRSNVLNLLGRVKTLIIQLVGPELDPRDEGFAYENW